MSNLSLRRFGRLLLNPMVWAFFALLLGGAATYASEGDLAIPDLHKGRFFQTPGVPESGITAWNLLLYGAFVICGTLGFSLYLRAQIKALPAHKSMLDVAEIIFQTCKTYLIQQGKFLLMLFALIAVAIAFYLWFAASHAGPPAPGEERMGTGATIFLVPCSRLSAWPGRTRWRGTASASTPTPTAGRRSPRSAASPGTWSTSRSALACRSACS
ncbi:MAG TPA: hypothetical protein VH120_05350 [Gemmataceae bacterium]|nr:hypothetical protein [Gemmataceae bacterium]